MKIRIEEYHWKHELGDSGIARFEDCGNVRSGRVRIIPGDKGLPLRKAQELVDDWNSQGSRYNYWLDKD